MVRIAEYCIRCGMCIDLHPQMFAFDYENDCICVLEEAQKPERREEARAMAADCPVAALQVTDSKEAGA